MNETATVTRRQGTLSAMFYPSYAYLWVATLWTTIAQCMEQVIMGWMVLELTNSPALVGLMSAARFAGMGLGPFLGALADRFDCKRIAVIDRAASVVYALAFVGLYYFNMLPVWLILTLALVGGALRAMDFTIRYAITPDTVETHNLTSAVGLMYAGTGASAVIGPLLGGYLYKPMGTGGTFLVMAVMYLASCVLLFPMHPPYTRKSVRQGSTWGSIVSGLRYVVSDKILFALMVIAALANLFNFPAVNAIMPVYARDVLQLGASGLGWLTAAEGLGALFGSLATSAMSRLKNKGLLLILVTLSWSISLGVFASLRVYLLGLLLLVVGGFSRGASMSLIQILLLEKASAEMRGRVSGIRMFAIVMLPLGNIISGAGSGWWGPAMMLILNAVAGVVTPLLTVLWVPGMVRREKAVAVAAAGTTSGGAA